MKILLILLLLPLLSISQKITTSKLCKSIEVIADKFDGKITTRAHVIPMTLIKTKLDSVETYYFQLAAHGSTISLREKGVIVLFADSTKLTWPFEDIDVEASRFSSGYTYTCFIKLNHRELQKIRNTLITDFRLYIYDATVKKKYAEEFIGLINCPEFN